MLSKDQITNSAAESTPRDPTNSATNPQPSGASKATNLGQTFIVYGAVKASSALVGHPFDVARSRVYQGDTTYAKAFADVYAQGGIRGIYGRGFAPTLVRMGVKAGVRGAVNDICGYGAMAPVVNSALDAVTLPLDKIRVIQQTSDKPVSFFNVAGKLFREYGICQAYRGLPFFTGKMLVTHGSTLAAYKATNALMHKAYPDQKVPMAAGFSASLAAGMAVATITNPFSRVLSNLQANYSSSTSATTVLTNLMKKEGARGLFRGSAVGYFFAALAQGVFYLSAKLSDEAKQ